MHKTTLTAIFLIIFFNSLGQEVNVIDGLNSPLGLVVSGTDLFICEHGTIPNVGLISKIDVTENNPTKTDLITGITYPRAMALVGDELYYASFYISKFNVNDTNPTPTQVISGGIQPRALLLAGDFLFVSGENGIYKFDVNASNPSLQLVVGNLEARPLSFVLDGDELYFGYSNKVSKLNVTDQNPVAQIVVSGLESGVYSLAFYNNYLLIGMALSQEVVKLDLNASIPQVEPFISTVSGKPMNMLVIGDDLYIAGGSGNTVFKIEDLPTVLSVDAIEPIIAIKVYPNPTSDVIKVLGIRDVSDYKLMDNNGREVRNGLLNEGEPLDISTLSSGIYYLKVKTNSLKMYTFKVIRK